MNNDQLLSVAETIKSQIHPTIFMGCNLKSVIHQKLNLVLLGSL